MHDDGVGRRGLEQFLDQGLDVGERAGGDPLEIEVLRVARRVLDVRRVGEVLTQLAVVRAAAQREILGVFVQKRKYREICCKTLRIEG